MCKRRAGAFRPARSLTARRVASLRGPRSTSPEEGSACHLLGCLAHCSARRCTELRCRTHEQLARSSRQCRRPSLSRAAGPARPTRAAGPSRAAGPPRAAELSRAARRRSLIGPGRTGLSRTGPKSTSRRALRQCSRGSRARRAGGLWPRRSRNSSAKLSFCWPAARWPRPRWIPACWRAARRRLPSTRSPTSRACAVGLASRRVPRPGSLARRPRSRGLLPARPAWLSPPWPASLSTCRLRRRRLSVFRPARRKLRPLRRFRARRAAPHPPGRRRSSAHRTRLLRHGPAVDAPRLPPAHRRQRDPRR